MVRREVRGEDDGLLVLVDDRPQSHVDLTDPTRLVFDYVRRMADVLDCLAPPGQPVRAIHVGGAGLTLPRYLAASRPRSSQIVLEPDEELTALVRAEIPLPPRSGIKVRPVDGRRGLRELPEARADVLVLDAYDEGRVPAELVTGPALQEVARVLAPTGVAILNIVDAAPFPLVRATVAGLRRAMPHLAAGLEPATRRARRPGNVLLVAGHRPLPTADWRSRAGGGVTPYQVLDDARVSSSFGGGTPGSDPDTAC